MLTNVDVCVPSVAVDKEFSEVVSIEEFNAVVYSAVVVDVKMVSDLPEVEYSVAIGDVMAVPVQLIF